MALKPTSDAFLAGISIRADRLLCAGGREQHSLAMRAETLIALSPGGRKPR
jgi:hypothetical protein